MPYKWCVEANFSNNSNRTPEKLFVSVPKNIVMREKWLQLAGRNPGELQPSTNIYLGEDHFEMEKDFANYNQFKMGFSQRLLLVEGALPSKLVTKSRLERKRLREASTSQSSFPKQQRMALNKVEDINVHQVVTSEPIVHHDKETITEPVARTDKSIHINMKSIKQVHFRSKAVQTKAVAVQDVSLSPCKISTASKNTSPFKIISCNLQPSTTGVTLNNKNLFPEEEKSDSDVSYLIPTSSSKISDSDTGATDVNVEIEKREFLKTTLHHVRAKPQMYIGIPKNCYFLVNLIKNHSNIPFEHILMCLKKNRLNTTFSELEDNFGISLSYGSKLFVRNIPVIASILRPFIVKIDKELILRRLPISFRHNYYMVSSIIDCLEIEIQKPSKALNQALTWSDYKKANTAKYLISCTPNGLVNYISPGFGGRASDITILNNCDFLDGLDPGTCILADRGFKHVDQLLSDKGIKLLRPPSVASGTKLSKTEVKQTKVIASLRIHIERVIRRIREFHMLRAHSVINSNILRVLDDIIVIACALVNIQDSLIK